MHDVARLQTEVVAPAFNFSGEGRRLFGHLEIIVEVGVLLNHSSHVVDRHNAISVADDEQLSGFVVIHTLDRDVFVLLVKSLRVHELDERFQALLQSRGPDCVHTDPPALVRHGHERVRGEELDLLDGLVLVLGLDLAVVAHVDQTHLAFAVAHCKDGAADGPVFARDFVLFFLAGLQDVNAVERLDVLLLALLAFGFGFEDEFGFAHRRIVVGYEQLAVPAAGDQALGVNAAVHLCWLAHLLDVAHFLVVFFELLHLSAIVQVL